MSMGIITIMATTKVTTMIIIRRTIITTMIKRTDVPTVIMTMIMCTTTTTTMATIMVVTSISMTSVARALVHRRCRMLGRLPPARGGWGGGDPCEIFVWAPSCPSPACKEER